ncbi:MAG: hypothetical protein WCF69_12435 [Mycobacterium sp.]
MAAAARRAVPSRREDGDYGEDLDAVQLLGPHRAHEFVQFAQRGVAKYQVGHRVDGRAVARIL